MAVFDDETGVREVTPGRWEGTVSPHWNIGDNPNGGYILALALNAVRRSLRHPDPLTVTAHYLAPCTPGTCEILIDVVKEGRSLSTATARIVQHDKPRLLAMATYGDLAASRGPTYLANAAPELPPPDACLARGIVPAFDPTRPNIGDRIELRIDPDTAGWIRGERGQPPSTRGWIRFADGRDADVHALALLVDAWPPALFNMMETGWVPTIELTVHVRSAPAPGWLKGLLTTRYLINGDFEEDCELWDSAGRLVALSRQLARVLPAAGR